MKEYRYSGPASGVTLSDGTEILLWPGKNVTLPEEHDYVKTLTALKHLTPVSEEAQPVTSVMPQATKRRNSIESDVKVEDAHVS